MKTIFRFSQLHLLICLVILPITTGLLFAGGDTMSPGKQESAMAAERMLLSIEKCVSEGDISALSEMFAAQTYLSLSTGQNGYYSANQAFYILQDFFKLHKPISFKLNLSSLDKAPYATGTYSFELRNKKGSAQVFISLKSYNHNWKISQITIR